MQEEKTSSTPPTYSTYLTVPFSEIDLRSTKISVTCRLLLAVNATEPGCYVTDTLILASY